MRLFIASILLSSLLTGCQRPHDRAPDEGLLPLGSQPVQEDHADEDLGVRAGLRITAVANYRLTALVMSTERYRFDKPAEVVPMDLALAWGPAARPEVQEQLRITQAHRAFYWRTKGTDWPLDRSTLVANMANVHIVPADDRVREQVLSLDPGDVVALDGQLVDLAAVDGSGGVRTSRVRTDAGVGACEVFYVTGVQVISAN